jgi:hypothetical protein
MSNMETFEYNPEMPSCETGWGGEAEYFRSGSSIIVNC